MAAVTGSIVNRIIPDQSLVMALVETPATADNADTIAITLADYGISKFLYILGNAHSTDNSVVITEAPTTAVSAGVLTITVGGATPNLKRVYLVVGAGDGSLKHTLT